MYCSFMFWTLLVNVTTEGVQLVDHLAKWQFSIVVRWTSMMESHLIRLVMFHPLAYLAINPIRFHLPVPLYLAFCRHEQSCSLLQVLSTLLRMILYMEMHQFGLLLVTYRWIRMSSSLLIQQSLRLLKQVASR